MKNNELLLTVSFEYDFYEMTLLVQKDITLKALLEALYYGLKNNDQEHFYAFKEYAKVCTQLVVLYRTKDETKFISVKENMEEKLCDLGIVTTSCVIIPKTNRVTLTPLFPDYRLPSLSDASKLEYNISTRRIAVAEPSVIDIIPPEDLPTRDKRSYFDVIIPTAISIGTLAASRLLLAMFRDDASGFSMLAMMMTTSISTMVTQSYNYIKQGKDSEKSIAEWKANYENYLSRIWDRILDWQKSDINYLRTTYPDIDELFKKTAVLDRAIFARNQNDSDFFKINLGKSEQVEPMFEIKNEKKDEIFFNIGYKIHKDDKNCRIEIILPKEKQDSKSKSSESHKTTLADDKDGLLTDLAYNLSTKTFRYLNAETAGELPPLLLDLKNCGALGIIEPQYQYSSNFVEHIIFELSYYHTPEDLQFVFFFDKESDNNKRAEKIRNYKNLPHVNELFEDASQFVFDKESAAVAFGKLQAIMGERTKTEDDEENNTAEENYTQIVCVIFDDYDIKETGFSKYLPKPPIEGEPYVNKNGLTFIFLCRHLAQLPRYCGSIIEVTSDTQSHAKVSARYNVLSRETLNNLSKSGVQSNTTSNIENLIDYKKFNNDYIFYDDNKSEGANIRRAYEEAYRRLSAVYYRRIAENGNVPSIVTLFELYKYTPEMIGNNEYIIDVFIRNWQKNDVTKNLAVPIGKNEHGVVDLDLYEKADGPHMLVAGTTGSGKSETIITYLIGLCMKYSPTYLNLMLVDMKGGGFSNRLRTLPHCVGVVDDTAGESEGISAVYMLKRFLEVLNAEIKQRKILLNEFGVDNVDSYIRAERIITQILSESDYSKIESLKKSLNKAQLHKLEECQKRQTKPAALSHLVLVVDEFTELKRFSSESDDIDFIAEITTIARVGRTLGFHIILVSQNIEGAITEDIRINSKSRICLKVATRTASKEMLDGRPDAASPTMPGNGRAYLLVGTGSKFMYFQSAYTGANKDEKIEPTVSVTQVLPCGNHNQGYYVSRRHNERIRRASKNVKEHDTQLSYVVQTIEAISRRNHNEAIFRQPRVIFKQPLEARSADVTKWR